jgi:membrane protease subunit (stomatin/prohibitin family)
MSAAKLKIAIDNLVKISNMLVDVREDLQEAANTMVAQNSASTNPGSPKFSPCGNCGSESTTDILVANGYNFCPRCGRKLRAGA